MNTIVFHPESDPAAIQEAAAILRRGGLVGIPTETVYGLGADALNEEAVVQIFLAKGRPQDNPLIIHVPDASWLEQYCRDVPPEAYRLAERFWPGPLTMILPRRDIVPLQTTGGLETVGVRCPDHPVTLAIIRAAGVPIAAPSGNTSGRPSPTTAAHMIEDMDGKIDGTMFGVRSEADAELTKKTLPMLRELYRRERSRVPVQMKLEIEEGGEKLTVTDADGNKAFAYGDAEPQPARTDPTESLSRSLSKTGGTPFSAEKIDVEMDGGPWFVPGSAVNELRRDALEALLKKREVLRPWPVHEAEPDALPLRTLPPRRTLRARFEAWEQVPEQALSGVEYLILPIAQADRVPREWREKTLLELPRVMFGALEEDTARRIAATQDAGFAGYEVSNIAHLRLCRGLPMTGGFGLNVTNQMAAQFYADHGLNSVLILPEVKDSDISTIAPTHNGKPVPTGVLVYGHMPLMVTRACPLQNIHDCAHCNKAGELTDRKAKKFPVRCGMGVRTIYNPVPIYMGDKPGALTVDYGVAYFTLESREEAAAILDSIRVHAPFEGEFTRGLYFKGTN